MADKKPDKSQLESSVIYDVSRARKTIFEDCSRGYRSHPPPKAQPRAVASPEGAKPVPATRTRSHRAEAAAVTAAYRRDVQDAEVYQVVDLHIDVPHEDSTQATDERVMGAGIERPPPRHPGKLVKSSSTTELLDADDDEPIAEPEPLRHRPPPPTGAAPAFMVTNPIVISQPSRWRPQSEIYKAYDTEREQASAAPKNEEKRPRTNHAWSYLACVIFFPLGILSWIKAQQSRKLLVERNYYRAKIAGDDAKGLAMLAIGVVIFLGLLFIIFYFTTIDRLGSLAPNT